MEVIIEKDKSTGRKILAVGCTGLDFATMPANRDVQAIALYWHV